MKTSKLEQLLEMATTTASIAIVPVGLDKSNTKEHGLEATREKLKKANKKGKKVLDPNSFSPVVMEYDFSKASQEAVEIASKYKAEGHPLDEIIKKLVKVFDMSVVRHAIREIK